MLCDRSLSFFHSFCHSVNRITDERGNGRPPNLVTLWKWLTFGGDPGLRVDSGSLFHFLHHWGIGDFRTSVIIYLFSQFSYNQQPICTILGEMTDANEIIHPQFGTDTTDIRIQINLNSNPWSILFQIWCCVWRRFALSITNRTSLINKTQNVWSYRFSKRRRLYVLSKMVSVIFAVLEVSFWALTTVVELPWNF